MPAAVPPGQWVAVRRVLAVPPLLAQQPAERPLVVSGAGAWQVVVWLPVEWLGGARQVAAWPADRWDAPVDRAADCAAGVRG